MHGLGVNNPNDQTCGLNGGPLVGFIWVNFFQVNL